MSEIDISEKEISSEWGEVLNKIESGVEFMLEAAEHLENPVGIDPIIYSEDTDVRVFTELSEQEQHQVLSIAFRILEINFQNVEVEDTYVIHADERFGWAGDTQVEVIKTGRSDENIFLHKRTSEDGVTDYFIATKEFRY